MLKKKARNREDGSRNRQNRTELKILTDDQERNELSCKRIIRVARRGSRSPSHLSPNNRTMMTAFKMDQTAGLEILSNNDKSFNNYDAFLAQFAASAKNAKSPLLINLAKTISTDEEQKTDHDHLKNEKPFSWLASQDA